MHIFKFYYWTEMIFEGEFTNNWLKWCTLTSHWPERHTPLNTRKSCRNTVSTGMIYIHMLEYITISIPWDQCLETGNVWWTNTPTAYMFFINGVTLTVGIETHTCKTSVLHCENTSHCVFDITGGTVGEHVGMSLHPYHRMYHITRL
jgi:hypothetical protein